MPNKFWARKDSKYKVVSSAPSVNLTPIGNAIVPVPYPVSEKLSKAVATADDVLVNGKPTYIHGSDTTSVKGDGKGSKGGVKSGTVEAKSQPIKAMASPTVKANKQHVVREGDLQMMQGGNTIGKITCSENASLVTIEDDGAIQGETLPSDLDGPAAQKLHQSAGQGAGAQSMPGATKPTAGGSSGGLGAATGSPVMLYTGQLYYVYDYMAITLAGKMEITPSLRYLSGSQYRGFFGRDRRFHYEKQFVALDEKRCRLYTAEGREFDFILQDQQYIDVGSVGVDVNHDGKYWILNYFDSTTEIYRNNRLLEIRDANQNWLKFDYKANGALLSIYNSSGARLHFEYNARHCVNRMYDHSQRTWQYHYDADDNLIQITPPAGRSEHYVYQTLQNTVPANGKRDEAPLPWSRLIEVRDSARKIGLSVGYGDNGRVNRYTEDSETFRYIYHQQKLVEKINQQQQSILYGLDDYGVIKAITAVDGSTQREDYNPTTRTAKIIINDGDPRIEEYDERHRLVSVTNGCCASCGHQVTYKYEGNNPQPAVVSDDGRKIINVYDERYNLLSTAISNDVIFKYQYDEKGRRTVSTDAKGSVTKFAYNDKDQITHIIDARDNIFQMTYDELGRKVSQSDPQGNLETFSYDILDLITHHRDELNHTTKFVYNDSQQLDHIIDASGNSTCYAYDKKDRVIGQQNGDESRRRYRHNDRGQLIAIQREDNSEMFFHYDDLGNVVQVTARQKTNDSSSENPRYYEEKLLCQYDSDGDLVSANLNGQKLTFNYDSESRLVASRQHGIEVSRWYTSKGDLHAGVGFMGESHNYRYDSKQRMNQVQRELDCITQLHNPNGDIIKRTFPNDLADTIQYDESSNITQITTANTRELSNLAELNYSIDSRGLLAEKNCSQTDKKIRYHYDAAGRLTSAGKHSFEYDDAGNLLLSKYDNALTYRATYNAANNQLLKNNYYQYSYDKRGNLVKKQRLDHSESVYYFYNLFDQLQEVSTYDENNECIKCLQFQYDALNRRVSKSLTLFENNQQVQQSIHHYLYDQHNIIAVLDEDKKLLASIVHGDEIDVPLSITTHNHEVLSLSDVEKTYFDSLNEIDQQAILKAKTQRTYYYHRDHQGSITMLTDANGEIVEQFEYDDSYGTVLKHTKKQETYNPYAYTGREFDAADLYYYRARYYDPQIQRFLSNDPMGFISGDTNFYRYVENNPVNFVDPAGYNPVCKAIERKKNKLYKKAIKPLAKVVAKQTAKLGAAAVPFVGWAMAAWSAYDLVNLGLELKDLYDQFDALEDALQKCLAKSKKVKTTKTKEKNKSKGKEIKCGDKKKYKDQGSGGHSKDKKTDSEKLDKDHLPSKGHVNNSVDMAEMSAAEKKCIKNQISKNMDTLAIPHDVHKAKTKVTAPHTTAGQAMARGKSLPDIAKAEVKEVKKQTIKKMHMNDPCRAAIISQLNEFEKLGQEYFDEIIDAAISHCL
ncbi:RHS repeat-associated core domain-containing protein [Agarilytica rhodophyticola]|uniref:RHS repeat-associated core domain-containing protein n=1 Tax=Agarilytica rhodophyticola TaxID=1737490 RepID=UPI000B3448E4|nr:RHS repeat-associated core domain-containing protein [Agarilytica rhodophyticola]